MASYRGSGMASYRGSGVNVFDDNVSRFFLENAQSLSIPGFRKIRNLNPHLLKWLHDASDLQVQNPPLLAESKIIHAMLLPTQIFLAYFAYWPLRDGQMDKAKIDTHIDFVGIAVFVDTQRAFKGRAPYDIGLLESGFAFNKLWNWRDLIDLIVKLVHCAKVKRNSGRSREDFPDSRSTPAIMLRRLCGILRHHWSQGTSLQERDFVIGYKFLTSAWANAFASTRARALQFVGEKANRKLLVDRVMGPIGPINLEVWKWDKDKQKEREDLDVWIEHIAATWCRKTLKPALGIEDDHNTSAAEDLIKPRMDDVPGQPYDDIPRSFSNAEMGDSSLQLQGVPGGWLDDTPGRPPAAKAMWASLPRRKWKCDAEDNWVQEEESESEDADSGDEGPEDISVMVPFQIQPSENLDVESARTPASAERAPAQIQSSPLHTFHIDIRNTIEKQPDTPVEETSESSSSLFVSPAPSGSKITHSLSSGSEENGVPSSKPARKKSKIHQGPTARKPSATSIDLDSSASPDSEVQVCKPSKQDAEIYHDPAVQETDEMVINETEVSLIRELQQLAKEVANSCRKARFQVLNNIMTTCKQLKQLSLPSNARLVPRKPADDVPKPMTVVGEKFERRPAIEDAPKAKRVGSKQNRLSED